MQSSRHVSTCRLVLGLRPCLPNSKIVIIHSGGDSRRSPLQSLCGKVSAWFGIECLGVVGREFLAARGHHDAVRFFAVELGGCL